jgi:hypothetical protein
LQFKNKLRLLTLAAIVVGILLGLFWAIPTAAKAPSQPNNDIVKNDEFIGPVQLSLVKDNAIQSIQSNNQGNIQPLQQSKHIALGSSPNGKSDGGRHYSKEEVIQLIREYSKAYDINPEVPLCIAKLESGYNQFSKNANSTASGIFQYLAGSTWKNTPEGKQGLSPFDAEANINAAIRHMAVHKDTSPWVVANKCPSL